MTFLLLLAQTNAPEFGWLSRKLLGVTLSSAEWVLWVLVVLSVALHRAHAGARRLLRHATGCRTRRPWPCSWPAASSTPCAPPIQGKKGMEAAVIREGLASTAQGADTVEQVIASTVARERPQYERFLSFLGTLGNNAPFIGLFGTVLGIIKAFHDLRCHQREGRGHPADRHGRHLRGARRHRGGPGRRHPRRGRLQRLQPPAQDAHRRTNALGTRWWAACAPRAARPSVRAARRP